MFTSVSKDISQPVNDGPHPDRPTGPDPSGNISSTAGFTTVEFGWSFKGMDEQKLQAGHVSINSFYKAAWMLHSGVNYTGGVVLRKYRRYETVVPA